jgi:hypothetical protein
MQIAGDSYSQETICWHEPCFIEHTNYNANFIKYTQWTRAFSRFENVKCILKKVLDKEYSNNWQDFKSRRCADLTKTEDYAWFKTQFMH